MRTEFTEKTFVLGIGAQKAGTSWLHRYLANHPEFFMSPVKELHWFDAKYREELTDHFNHRFIQQAVDWIREKPVTRMAASPAGAALLDRVAMICDEAGYRKFYESRVPGECDFFGEVTPSYALLPVRGFREIRQTFPNVKIIFLLRDPVDRMFSALRMGQRKKNFDSASDVFMDALKHPLFVERSLYHQTIARLEKVFAAAEVFVGFYETLFHDEGIAEVCKFLGCEFLPGQYERKVNSDQCDSTDELPPAAVEAGVKAFTEVYAFCRNRYGARVPSTWRG